MKKFLFTLGAVTLFVADDLVVKKISGLPSLGLFSQALTVDLDKVKNLVFVSGQVPNELYRIEFRRVDILRNLGLRKMSTL
jgi:hypothetical protein